MHIKKHVYQNMHIKKLVKYVLTCYLDSKNKRSWIDKISLIKTVKT